ncbi:MAG: type I restriction enzyme HsdR N-terminal domain-containing protein [Desulfovibrio aminophilus]|uniref:type I restriction enzyme HsdR N-terminal domain-containing protein n=1 Tax=Desulfovibrio aminophilus TaxID=81425 RepID=UPI0039EBE000
MHETSLGGTLRDYLTGEEIEETTYEEFRQALARLLVEERGYPRDRLRAKVELPYEVDGEAYSRRVDLVAYDPEDRPALLVFFSSGDVGSYERETVVAARLFPGGPVPLALVTDTMQAQLLDTVSGEVLASGMASVPTWDDLLGRTRDVVRVPPTTTQRAKLTRIFHTYCGFLFGACCSESCSLPPKRRSGS